MGRVQHVVKRLCFEMVIFLLDNDESCAFLSVR